MIISGVARALTAQVVGFAHHQKDQNEEENEENLRKIYKDNRKMRKHWIIILILPTLGESGYAPDDYTFKITILWLCKIWGNLVKKKWYFVNKGRVRKYHLRGPDEKS